MLKCLTEITALRRENPSATSFMRYTAERAGVVTGEIREWWPLDEISLLACAIVKAEDFCFTRHHGVSWQATLFASLAAWRTGQGVRGVSTITQQLARNLFLTPERKMSRKFREMLLALAMDRLRRVGCSWDLAASRKECKNCLSSFCNEREISFRTNAKFEPDRALVYTFEGKLLSHR